MTQLAAGDRAPDVTLPRNDGGTVSLARAPGPVVLYFYPRDDTSGCTTEALDFTARLQDFAALAASVWGVSKDSVASHERFIARKGLGVVLLSDAEGDVCERYGVWQEKKMYGKTFMGIVRSTFLIGTDGRIARVWTKVKVPGHAAEVLEAVRAL